MSREPRPFLPLWTVFRPSLPEHGEGLLTGTRVGIRKFVVDVGDFQITVMPMLGHIYLDSRLTHQSDIGSELVWFRRMRIHLGTHDHNSAAPECLCYGIGLSSNGVRSGYMLFADGHIEEGCQ